MAGDLQVNFIIRAIDRATAPLRQVTRNFETMRAASARARKSFQVAADLRQSASGVATLASKVRSVLMGPISAFEEFDSAIAELRGVSKLGAESMNVLEAEALRLGKAVGEFDPTGAARGMIELSRASFTQAEIMSELPHFLDLATASSMELAPTIKTLTDVMGGYAMTAKDTKRASDIMTAAANASKTNFAGMAETLSYAGPILKDAGFGFKEAAVMAGLLANASLDASRGGTTLNAILARMTGAARGPGAKILEDMKIQLTEMRGGVEKFRMLPSIISDINEKIKDLPLEKKLGVFGRIFGSQGATGALALASAIDGIGLEKLNKAMDATTDRTKNFAIEMRNSAKNETEQLTSAINTLNITLGKGMKDQTSAAKTMIKGIIESIGEWASAHPKLTKAIFATTGAVAVLTTALAALLFTASTLTSGFGAFQKAMGGIRTGGEILAGSLGKLYFQLERMSATTAVLSGETLPPARQGVIGWTRSIWRLVPALWASATGSMAAVWPILAIVAAIAAVTAVVYLSIKHWDTLVGVWERFKNASMTTKIVLGLLLAPIVALLSPIIALVNLAKGVMDNWKPIADFFKSFWEWHVDIVNKFVSVLEKIQIPDALKDFGQWHIDVAKNVGGAIADVGRETAFIAAGGAPGAQTLQTSDFLKRTEAGSNLSEANIKLELPPGFVVTRMDSKGGANVETSTPDLGELAMGVGIP